MGKGSTGTSHRGFQIRGKTPKMANNEQMSFTLHSPTGLEPDCQETVRGSAPRQLRLTKDEKIFFHR